MQGFDKHEGEEWWQSKRETCSLCFPFMSFRLDLVILQSTFQLSLWFLPWTAKRPHLSLSWQHTVPISPIISMCLFELGSINRQVFISLLRPSISAAPSQRCNNQGNISSVWPVIISTCHVVDYSLGRTPKNNALKNSMLSQVFHWSMFVLFRNDWNTVSKPVSLSALWVNLWTSSQLPSHLSTCFLHPKCCFVPILLLIEPMQKCGHISLGTLWDMPAKAMICSAMRAWPKSASMLTWKREGTRFEEKRHKHKQTKYGLPLPVKV